ncbi:hypothetical protein [Streptomyces sp. NPDC005166]
MKAIDDITCTEVDYLIIKADRNFGYDREPLRVGELGAGILGHGEAQFDDTELSEAKGKPDWLLEAGF